jgi:hypothetical protein
MYPHRIRLRGPWRIEDAGKQTVPWSELAGGSQHLRARRSFGFPGRIDAYERVWMTFGGLPAAARISLNGSILGRQENAETPFEFDVTALLQGRNELTVELLEPPIAGAGWGEVAMEVRATAYLRNVRAHRDGATLRVTGEVVGTCDRPLDLYVLADNKTVHYSTVAARAEGQSFTVTCDKAAVRQVRVELVNGASVWYRWECSEPAA